jgi:hypothetical protein
MKQQQQHGQLSLPQPLLPQPQACLLLCGLLRQQLHPLPLLML